MNMAWETIVDASSLEELRYATPTIQELPKDTEIIIRVDLPAWLPAGKLANLAGAEWWAQQLAGSGMEVIDVYGDWTWMEVKGKADPIWLFALIPLIIRALIALGIAIAAVKISANVFVEPSEIAQQREAEKIRFIETWAPTYGAEAVTRWLKGIESPPPGVTLPSWAVPAGIGVGVLITGAIVLLLLFRKRL